MSSHIDVLASAGLAVLVLMVLVWLISLPLRDASIVDIAWGFGLVLTAWVAWAVGDGDTNRSGLIVAMVSIWGLRLTVHLAWRSRGRGEDYRYASMRRRVGDGFAIQSLFTVFLFQAVLISVVALPVHLAMTPTEPAVRSIAILGVCVWGLGFFFETVGDAQLVRFKADPANEGQVLDWGLWRYTRHPNYFGASCAWWGIWLVAADTPAARWGIIGPIVMTVLLMRVSGIPILERGLHRRRSGYDEYVARTSTFFPRPPRPSQP